MTRQPKSSSASSSSPRRWQRHYHHHKQQQQQQQRLSQQVELSPPAQRFWSLWLLTLVMVARLVWYHNHPSALLHHDVMTGDPYVYDHDDYHQENRDDEQAGTAKTTKKADHMMNLRPRSENNAEHGHHGRKMKFNTGNNNRMKDSSNHNPGSVDRGMNHDVAKKHSQNDNDDHDDDQSQFLLWEHVNEDDVNHHHAGDDFNTTAACLMYNDDLDSLREWIPYHYHVANLRHLLLRVDPKSRDDPINFLNKWSSKMHIEIWYNDTFVTDEDRDAWRDATERMIRKDAQAGVAELSLIHNIFINKCLHRLKQRGVGWTLVIDPDEYLRINYRTVSTWNDVTHAASGAKLSSSIAAATTPTTMTSLQLSPAPPISKPGSVMIFLQQEYSKRRRNDRAPYLGFACIQIPRSRFGAVEDSTVAGNNIRQHEQQQQRASSSLSSAALDPMRYNTVRYRYHAFPESPIEGNRVTKAMVNVRHITNEQLAESAVLGGNMHNPVPGVCANQQKGTAQQDHVLILNHYSGSEEQFLFRNDKRRSLEFFWSLANIHDMNDDAIVPWLDGFVQEHGIEQAQHLLSTND